MHLYGLTEFDDIYPQLFRHLPENGDDKRPGPIFVEGSDQAMALLNQPAVAIIGSRETTEVSRQTADTIAEAFARAGIVVVAGLALGIDTAAHEAALRVGGKTIAVVSAAIAREPVWPPQNIGLAQRILDNGGLLMTQYSDRVTDRQSRINRLLARDRLQAALSAIVIPVQCGVKSGTMHTVGWGRKLNRMLAVPMPPKADQQAYPDRYAGVVQLHREGVPYFTGKDLTGLIEAVRYEDRRLRTELNR